MKVPYALLVALVLSACGPGPQSEWRNLSDERPNIVIILADDMGYSDLGCYGGEIATPNLDRLAADGLRFRHFYNAARCCPTRAALLTGQYPHVAGMGGMVSSVESSPEEGSYQGYLREDLPTIAERLGEAGYRNYMSGKWHVGEKPEHWPLRRGFDRYFGLISGASSYYTLRTDQARERQMVLDSV
ncbi:MAG: sulfatase-like hydrolase/transferase, partial [Lewinella sp.]